MRQALVGAVLLFAAACAVVENATDRKEMRVEGARLFIRGEVTSRTPARFDALLAANPQLREVVLEDMSGATDDGAVLGMGYRIRDRGLTTRVPAGGEIFSGAVTLFLAGDPRIVAPGAVLGVHDWEDGFGRGSSYPRDAREHAANVAYVRYMLGSDAFYWFTLQAAPPDGIHVLTRAEMMRFGVLTLVRTN
ncbi:hypothetical protein AB2B41_02945 [Marimonas sp. MJW-29]|uniref:Lipoprotein n=1 Tax=Sulfitobacter sediminis TaxID=3234186 RepID=A0ABV3RHV5_9RHOB